MSQPLCLLHTPDLVCDQTGLVSSRRSLHYCHIQKYSLTEDVRYVKVRHLLRACVCASAYVKHILLCDLAAIGAACVSWFTHSGSSKTLKYIIVCYNKKCLSVSFLLDVHY